MIKFINQKNTFTPTTSQVTIVDDLTPAIYDLNITLEGGIELTYVSDKFKEPEKYYGERIYDVASFTKEGLSRSRSPYCAILHGNAGTGKSMTARYMANRYIETEKRPVVRVNMPLPTDMYKGIIRMLGGCCFYIDEYEKLNFVDKNSGTHANDDPLLTVLDDEELPSTLFILTANLIGDVSPHLRERPGRVGTMVHYANLSNDELVSYLAETLTTTDVEIQLALHAAIDQGVTFDILKTLVYYANTAATVDMFHRYAKMANAGVHHTPAFNISLTNWEGDRKELHDTLDNLAISWVVKDHTVNAEVTYKDNSYLVEKGKPESVRLGDITGDLAIRVEAPATGRLLLGHPRVVGEERESREPDHPLSTYSACPTHPSTFPTYGGGPSPAFTSRGGNAVINSPF